MAQALSNTLEEVYRLQVLPAPDGAAHIACQFLGVLVGGAVPGGGGAAVEARAPQRGLIDEMPEDDDNDAGAGLGLGGGPEEDEAEAMEQDPAGLLSSMMSMSDE